MKNEITEKFHMKLSYVAMQIANTCIPKILVGLKEIRSFSSIQGSCSANNNCLPKHANTSFSVVLGTMDLVAAATKPLYI